MEEDIYKAVIIIGTIGIIFVIVIFFWDEIGGFFKAIFEWLIIYIMHKGKFDPITMWDWVFMIGIIIVCVIYCIVKILED
ncbi:MAG: hypothetical protein ACFFCM_00655 [Promethearchaeota archaeon]